MLNAILIGMLMAALIFCLFICLPIIGDSISYLADIFWDMRISWAEGKERYKQYLNSRK